MYHIPREERDTGYITPLLDVPGESWRHKMSMTSSKIGYPIDTILINISHPYQIVYMYTRILISIWYFHLMEILFLSFPYHRFRVTSFIYDVTPVWRHWYMTEWLFPQIILAILLSWFVCFVLTAAGALSTDQTLPQYHIRTDVHVDVLVQSPWIQFPILVGILFYRSYINSWIDIKYVCKLFYVNPCLRIISYQCIHRQFSKFLFPTQIHST